MKLRPWGGMPVAENELDVWIEDAAKDFEKHLNASPENFFSHVSLSGDSLVVMSGWRDRSGAVRVEVWRTTIESKGDGVIVDGKIVEKSALAEPGGAS